MSDTQKPVSPRPRAEAAWWAALIAAAAALAYSRTFSDPLVFDDLSSITENPTLRHLSLAFTPPLGATVSGRPVLNLSFALNYALGGDSLAGLHAANLAIHILSAVALLGVLRRLLSRDCGPDATLVAGAAALLWSVHPLLTESVTYVVQRAESLMALWYLLTAYLFLRGSSAPARTARGWYAASVATCALGMGTKEVMATAPVAILLLDRAFVSGSFRQALRLRAGFYCGLAATWGVLGALMLSTNGRSGSAGFGTAVSPWAYSLTQAGAVLHYMRLCLWPHPLVFDYGTALAAPSAGAALRTAAIGLFVAGTLWTLVKRPALGTACAVFLVVLAPSSSFIPVATEPIAEHRMYLPLCAVVVLVVLGLHRLLGRQLLAIAIALSALLGSVTWERNQIYGSVERLWQDTVLSVPGNPRAWTQLGNSLALDPKRLAESTAAFAKALSLDPGSPEAHYNLANALAEEGRNEDALREFTEALRLRPAYFEAHTNLANLLRSEYRLGEAIPHYREALALRPNLALSHYNLGNALGIARQDSEAEAELAEAIRLDPVQADALYSLGTLRTAMGRPSEALSALQEAVRLRPGFPEARYALARALLSAGSPDEATTQLREAVRLRPEFSEAHCTLGNALAARGLLDQAVQEYLEALRSKSDYSEAECNLGNVLSALGRGAEAQLHYAAAIRDQPDFPEAHFGLANLLVTSGRTAEGAREFAEAVRLRPEYAEAQCNLGSALSALDRPQEAIPHFEYALRIRPDYALAHMGLAVALLHLPGRMDDAVAHLREVVKLRPDDGRAQQILERIESLKRQ